MNLELPRAVEQVLRAALTLGGAVWIGGFVTITVVSSSAKDALSRVARIALFRALGRKFLIVAIIAAALVLVAGGILLATAPFDAITIAILVAVACLVTATALGVAQARQMTRLRTAAAASPDDEGLQDRVARRASAARILRAVIGVAILALFVLAFVRP